MPAQPGDVVGDPDDELTLRLYARYWDGRFVGGVGLWYIAVGNDAGGALPLIKHPSNLADPDNLQWDRATDYVFDGTTFHTKVVTPMPVGFESATLTWTASLSADGDTLTGTFVGDRTFGAGDVYRGQFVVYRE